MSFLSKTTRFKLEIYDAELAKVFWKEGLTGFEVACAPLCEYNLPNLIEQRRISPS